MCVMTTAGDELWHGSQHSHTHQGLKHRDKVETGGIPTASERAILTHVLCFHVHCTYNLKLEACLQQVRERESNKRLN